MSAWPNAKPPRSAGLQDVRESVTLDRILELASVLLLLVGGGLLTAKAAEVPVIKGEAGPCTADFTVTDSSSKPLYDAKIRVIVRYGFMSKRKADLEIGTDSNGKARIEGLPDKVKRPLEFHVRFAQQTKSVAQDPASNCHANFPVVMGTQ